MNKKLHQMNNKVIRQINWKLKNLKLIDKRKEGNNRNKMIEWKIAIAHPKIQNNLYK
jgi:hypothetical protein